MQLHIFKPSGTYSATNFMPLLHNTHMSQGQHHGRLVPHFPRLAPGACDWNIYPRLPVLGESLDYLYHCNMRYCIS